MSYRYLDIAERAWPLFEPGTAFETAAARLAEAGLGDGLPIVVPTCRRLAAMLDGIDQDMFDAARHRVPPLMHALTVAAVAYNAVLAGCRPEELPVLLTTVIAALDPRLKLLELQTTTGAAAVGMIVHGPIAAKLGMASETNCLGPGNRVNACLGRALALVLAHVGGARPGVVDLATLGQPAKYLFCFAEGRHPTLPSLPRRRGFGGSASAVTVLAVGGMTEVLPRESLAMPDTLVEPLAAAVCGAEAAAGNALGRHCLEYVLVLPPMAWQRLDLADCGWMDLDARLAARCRALAPQGRRTFQLLCAGGIGEKMLCLHPWSGGSLSVTRALDAFG